MSEQGEDPGVTWADIYDSPEVDRSLRRLPRLCREAVELVWAAGRRELLVVLAIKAVNGTGLAAIPRRPVHHPRRAGPRPWTPGPSTSCSRASGPCAGGGRCC